MTREKFLSELKEIHLDVVELGKATVEAIHKGIQALINQDKEIARAVIEGDERIDEMEEAITSKGMRIILHQQPVANDFKEISAVLKLVTDMERIADQASDIAKLSLNFNGPFIKKIEHIPLMSEMAKEMVSGALNAFIENSQEDALRIIEQDDEMDELYQKVRRELIRVVPETSEENAEQIVDLLVIAKYLERIGDHATNICEWIIFNHTGVHKKSKLI